MSKYTEKDAAKDTNSSSKDTTRAWHDARDDAAKDGDWGVPEDRHDKDDNNSDGGGGILDAILDIFRK